MDNKTLHDCIIACWDCRQHCQKTFYHHCLDKGGAHTTPEHVKSMSDCIQICQINADFMIRQSQHINEVNKACAAICESCALSCEKIGDEAMLDCAKMCRKCSKLCATMSQ